MSAIAKTKGTRPIMKAIILATTALGSAFAMAQAASAEGWMIRGRGIAVVPDEKATISIGGDVNIDTSIVPEFDLTYFFTDNIAVEVIAAITPHDISAVGTALGDFPVGNTTLLPPTVTLQYHLPFENGIKPYVGAGLNVTWFLDKDVDPAGPITDFKTDTSVGFAAQAGIDFPIGDRWVFNIDAKKVWISTDVEFNGGAVTADVKINPWIIGTGFGYRF